VKSERLIDGKADGGNETIVELTTETMTKLGTDDGTADAGATTVLEPTQTNEETGIPGAHEAGIATGDENVYGIVIVAGTVTTDDVGNETTVDVTIEKITTDGTDDGTDEIKTKTVFEPISTMLDGAKAVTYDAGTATTDDTGHVSGITTVDGIVTTDDDGNETIVDVTIETITIDGTDDGTDEIKTKTVDEPISITDDGANEVTHETGTATTDDTVHESGITTVDGIVTIDDDGN